MLGYTEEELRKLTFLELTLDDYRESNWQLITELLDGKRKQFQIEKKYRRNDGTLARIHADVREPGGPRLNPEFGVFGFYCGVTNITVRVEREFKEGGAERVEALLRS